MAQALGWDRVASFYIDLEAPVLPSGIPKPGPLQMQLPDDHMRYAIIWFSLAGLLLIAFAVWLALRRMSALRHERSFNRSQLL
jgi:cytochrome oxidase assembly protein ShyY1